MVERIDALNDLRSEALSMKHIFCISFVLLISFQAQAQDGLTQVHQDFAKDPGWDWKNNRVVAEDPPTVKQDFGWSSGDHIGTGPGEIGGTIWQSQTPAWYALPLNRPLSFKDKFSFS